MNNFEKIQNLLKDEYDKLEIKDKKNNNGIKYEPKDIFIDKATISAIKLANIIADVFAILVSFNFIKDLFYKRFTL